MEDSRKEFNDLEGGHDAPCDLKVEHSEHEEPIMTAEERKKIIRNIDWRVLPPLTILYILSYMDRSNIGNARIAGMNDELGLTPEQYNIALTVFFFPYALFEVPSNIVLKLMRPSRWMTILVISWGTVLALQGIVRNYEELVITRVFLGLTEAGFFPAATYLLTTWYCRWEVQTRLAIFFSAASLAGAFSGLFAWAITHMDGVGGRSGWRWIFIMEGVLTIFIGLLIPFLLPDSPATAKWLTPEQKQKVIRRLEADAGTSAGRLDVEGNTFKWKYLRQALTDKHIYLGVVIFMGQTIAVYGFSFTAPTIINELGYTAQQAQLLTIPIYFMGAVSTITFARIADKRKKRWPFVVIPFCMAVVGFIFLLAIPHPRLPGLTYGILFLIPCGLYPAVIGCIAWVSNNLAPTFKRAIGMAVLMTLGNLGGAIGSNIFLSTQSPTYWLGYGFSLGSVSCAIAATFLLRFFCLRENKKRELMDAHEVQAQYTEEQLLDMGDKSPLFRYVT